jgi:hypothetical protein
VLLRLKLFIKIPARGGFVKGATRKNGKKREKRREKSGKTEKAL